VEQGAERFVRDCFQTPANAYEEARRGTYDPTYLVYTYGKLQIHDLRREYLSQKGARSASSTTPSSPRGAAHPPGPEALFEQR
jgi:hypothetical protein